MAFQTPKTISETLNEVAHRHLVLPAIQREFVWRPSQIRSLFDSIMQGYPFGTLLYWRVKAENSGDFQFYDFVLNYHQKDNPHCPPLGPMHNQQLTAVLDGQQRLTALNIGLRGSMAWKRPRFHWTSPWAFPTRKLYIDLLWQPLEDEETGSEYRFSFLIPETVKPADKKECWFLVGDVLGMSDMDDVWEFVSKLELPQEYERLARRTLVRLYRVVHDLPLIAFYQEEDQELDKVLQIFIRMNSGGTVLSYSDMLLSVAVAQWDELDAREEIHTLVDDLNKIGNGFSFSKDWVLKAGLMLSDIRSVGFKVDNFNTENMDVLEAKWDDVKRALMLTAELISGFGFSRDNLRAHNAILPIAYYLYLKNPGERYLTSRKFRQDRQAIREWLIRSLLKSGVWSSGVDTLLTVLRQVIRENGGKEFPLARISGEMAQRGRPLTFDEEEIEGLADMNGSRMTFALLSLIFPFVDLQNNQFHIDHIFPASRFTVNRLRNAGVPEDKISDFIQRRNGLANFQLLQGIQNIEKSAMMPAKWLIEAYPDTASRQAYKDRHMLGEVPESIACFDTFYEARRERLKAKIAQLLGRQHTASAVTSG